MTVYLELVALIVVCHHIPNMYPKISRTHTATTQPIITVSLRRREWIMEISELIPGIWLNVRPIRDSTDVSKPRC